MLKIVATLVFLIINSISTQTVSAQAALSLLNDSDFLKEANEGHFGICDNNFTSGEAEISFLSNTYSKLCEKLQDNCSRAYQHTGSCYQTALNSFLHAASPRSGFGAFFGSTSNRFIETKQAPKNLNTLVENIDHERVTGLTSLAQDSLSMIKQLPHVKTLCCQNYSNNRKCERDFERLEIELKDYLGDAVSHEKKILLPSADIYHCRNEGCVKSLVYQGLTHFCIERSDTVGVEAESSNVRELLMSRIRSHSLYDFNSCFDKVVGGFENDSRLISKSLLRNIYSSLLFYSQEMNPLSHIRNLCSTRFAPNPRNKTFKDVLDMSEEDIAGAVNNEQGNEQNNQNIKSLISSCFFETYLTNDDATMRYCHSLSPNQVDCGL